MEKLATEKGWRIVEAFAEIFFKLLGIYITYYLFNKLAMSIVGKDFNNDTLLSLLLLPALYILRDIHIILEPCFIIVEKNNHEVTVTRGKFYTKVDTLNLHSVDNIEVVRTPLGHIFNYGTITLYGYGGLFEIPFVKDVDNISKVFVDNANKRHNKYTKS